jgi:hypothetical protein
LAFFLVGKDIALCFLGGLIFFTGFALAKFSQQLMWVQPSVMPIIPEKLDRVQTHRLYIFGSNRIRDHTGLDFFLAAPLIDAVRTGTTFPQPLNSINRFMPIGPCDAQCCGVDLP